MFLILSKWGYSQNSAFLNTYNNTALNDTTRILALYDLIWEKVYTNIDSAETLAKIGLESKLTAKYPKYKTKFFNAYGAIYQTKGHLKEAINFYQQGLKLSEQNNDLRGQAIMLGNIGGIYTKLKQTDLALNFCKKCLSVLKQLKDEYNQASVYNNLSVVYLEDEKFDLSMQYALQSVALYKKFDDKNGLVYCHNNIANIFEKRKLNDKALENYKIALQYAIETENSLEIGRCYHEIGNALLLKGDNEQAKEYLEKAKKLAQENEDIDTESDVVFNLYEYYKKKNKPSEALKAHEYYHELRDKLDRESKRSEINRLQSEFDYQKKVQQDSVLMAVERSVNSEKLKAKNADLAAAKAQLIAIVVVVALLIIVSLVIYNRFRLTQRQKQIIEAKNKQTEEQKLIIEEKQKEILDSINYAKRIQDSLLDNFEYIKHFFSDAFVLNKPKDIVSGDFYWLSKRNEVSKTKNKSTVTEVYFVSVCDSTGHGVPGGFMSLLNVAYLSEAINEKGIYEPNKIFDYVRERLINTISKNDQKDGFDGVLMRFDKKMTFDNHDLINTEFTLSYAGAYNSPIIVRDRKIIELEADKMPVGYGERKENFNLYSHDLQKGDVIYMYTDGYADQFGGPRGKKFKYKQLNDLLLTVSDAPMENQMKLINQQFEDWKGDMEQVDDVCLVGIRI